MMQLVQRKVAQPKLGVLFDSASHQAGFDAKSMTRRSIILGFREEEGQEWAEVRALLDYRGHRSTVQCGPDEPRWTWILIWVQAHMPYYSLNWTAKSSAIQGWQSCQWCSLPTRKWPSGQCLQASKPTANECRQPRPRHEQIKCPAHYMYSRSTWGSGIFHYNIFILSF